MTCLKGMKRHELHNDYSLVVIQTVALIIRYIWIANTLTIFTWLTRIFRLNKLRRPSTRYGSCEYSVDPVGINTSERWVRSLFTRRSSPLLCDHDPLTPLTPSAGHSLARPFYPRCCELPEAEWSGCISRVGSGRDRVPHMPMTTRTILRAG